VHDRRRVVVECPACELHRLADTNGDQRRVGHVEQVRHLAAARPHAFGAPHPHRDDRHARHLREARGAPTPFQLRIEERRTARDRALRHQRDELTAAQRVGRGDEGLVRSGAAIDADTTERLRHRPDHRRVEHLFLAEEAHRTASLRQRHPHRQRIEVAAVVADDDRPT
jgi:hypothetical protein